MKETTLEDSNIKSMFQWWSRDQIIDVLIQENIELTQKSGMSLI